MKQKIVIVPDPILRQKSKPVAVIDKKILALIADMKDTMDSKGAGISAPQIGKSLRMCVVKSRAKKEMIVFINPEITYRS
ncbi:MAG: peptide deformylase, partial [bacterium]|nr:peptide deformylase [bacterium]